MCTDDSIASFRNMVTTSSFWHSEVRSSDEPCILQFLRASEHPDVEVFEQIPIRVNTTDCTCIMCGSVDLSLELLPSTHLQTSNATVEHMQPFPEAEQSVWSDDITN